MIKLVASDFDGTLIPEGTKDINPKFYDVVRGLHEKGIIFVAASGRELESMMNVVSQVKDIVYGISNNGARVTNMKAENLSILTLKWDLVKQIIEDVRKDNNCEFISFSTMEGTFTETKNQDVIDWIVNGYGLSLRMTDDMLASPKEVMKIAIFMNSDAIDHVQPYIDKYGAKARVAASGKRWIDFTHPNADKGLAFKNLLDMLSIKPEETWAFGDNNNDISMIKTAGRGFAAPGAREEVLEAADECLEGNLYDAVVNKLEELL